MNNRKNAYTEVYTILQELNEEEYNKIPPEVIETIEANRDEDYEYELDDEVELKEQPMLPETKAILFNLFRDYLATPEQKAKIIRMQNEERQKNELKKQQMYNSDIFANKPKENLTENNSETMQIVEYKESIFKRILNKIKSFFIKKLWAKGKYLFTKINDLLFSMPLLQLISPNNKSTDVIDDYKEIFTDIISDRIKQKYK